MKKVPVEFLRVRGAFVTGNRAAFPEAKVAELEKAGVVRRLTDGEIAKARAASVKAVVQDAGADIRVRLAEAEGKLAAAQASEAKALAQIETLTRERDDALAELAAAKLEATKPAPDEQAAQDAPEVEEKASKTKLASADAGAPPKQGGANK
ncbi:hypothetical protein Q4560_05110 [Celeribacter halophilus]|uniref:hypothetical protein n=1 Tax=Celeribacter halophilus TaxID=576117 RepID=UPI0026E20154|nr:hypothetical protein [Celeribacter halophilus]MDO6722636.1 hypothetical protein [Celeribacter halophilus]